MKRQECEQLTLFQEASPASRLVLPGSEEARKMTVTSGQKCLELYQNSGPLGLLVRMLLGSSIWRSTRCALTWKTKVTPSKRLLFRLVPLTPRIGGTGAQLWRTPNASDSAGRGEYADEKAYMKRLKRGKQMSLSNQVKFPALWPTPTTGAGLCGGTGNFQQLKKLKDRGQITEEERRNMSQGNGGRLNPDWVEWLMGFPVGWTSLQSQELQPAFQTDQTG